MKNKRNIIIVICFVIFLILLLLLFVSINYKPNKNNKKSVEKNSPPSADVYDGDEIFNAKYDILLQFEKKYPEGYKFDVGGDNTITYTIDDLKKMGIDISGLNTKTIHCDLESGALTVDYIPANDYYLRKFNIDCTK